MSLLVLQMYLHANKKLMGARPVDCWGDFDRSLFKTNWRIVTRRKFRPTARLQDAKI